MKPKTTFVLLVMFIVSTAAISVFGQDNANILNRCYYLPLGSQPVSPNDEYKLIYQEDGNLVLYGEKNICSSNSNNTGNL